MFPIISRQMCGVSIGPIMGGNIFASIFFMCGCFSWIKLLLQNLNFAKQCVFFLSVHDKENRQRLREVHLAHVLLDRVLPGDLFKSGVCSCHSTYRYTSCRFSVVSLYVYQWDSWCERFVVQRKCNVDIYSCTALCRWKTGSVADMLECWW